MTYLTSTTILSEVYFFENVPFHKHITNDYDFQFQTNLHVL